MSYTKALKKRIPTIVFNFGYDIFFLLKEAIFKKHSIPNYQLRNQAPRPGAGGKDMETRKYNGWTNYETWLVGLWFDNDSSQYWQERAQEIFDDTESDATFTRKENSTFALADEMQEQIEENAPATTGLYADLVNGALSEVNWHEIAEHYIDEIEEEDAA